MLGILVSFGLIAWISLIARARKPRLPARGSAVVSLSPSHVGLVVAIVVAAFCALAYGKAHPATEVGHLISTWGAAAVLIAMLVASGIGQFVLVLLGIPFIKQGAASAEPKKT